MKIVFSECQRRHSMPLSCQRTHLQEDHTIVSVLPTLSSHPASSATATSASSAAPSAAGARVHSTTRPRRRSTSRGSTAGRRSGCVHRDTSERAAESCWSGGLDAMPSTSKHLLVAWW